MITRAEAERLAHATHALRPDWPIQQLLTLIDELKAWPMRDLGIGLAYVALDQTTAGDWITKTPYRVREDGPWRTIGIANADIEADRRRTMRDLEIRYADTELRWRAVEDCLWCDAYGRLAGGVICYHDLPPDVRAAQAAARAAAVRSEIRPTVRYPDQEQTA